MAQHNSPVEGGTGPDHRDHLDMGACAEATDEEAYLAYERGALAMLATRYREIDPDDRRELYQEAWASVLRKRSRGGEVDDLGAYLMGAVDKLAAKRVFGADARRRRTFDPTVEFAAVTDPAARPDERVVDADEARRVRTLVDELDMPERAVLRLRLDEGLEAREIRDRLGLTDRQYRRIAERAGKSLLAQFEAFDRGDWARQKRSLLCACVMGIASKRQWERAQALVAGDPMCRAMMSELRRLGGSAAALIPAPGVALELHSGRMQRAADALSGRAAEALAHAKAHAADAVSGAKQHAAAVYMRATDPTPLAAARPGAAVAVLASCVAAGGGAYCAVEGVPDGLRPAIGIERSQADAQPEKPSTTDTEPVSAPVAPSPTDSQPEPQAPASPSPATPQTPPQTSAPASVPASPPEKEFEPAAQPASPEPASQPATRPQVTASPAPARSGSGEFAP